MNKNGEMGCDEQGEAMQAHGGGIVEDQGRWYWW